MLLFLYLLSTLSPYFSWICSSYVSQAATIHAMARSPISSYSPRIGQIVPTAPWTQLWEILAFSTDTTETQAKILPTMALLWWYRVTKSRVRMDIRLFRPLIAREHASYKV
jgi:hypothetical protein